MLIRPHHLAQGLLAHFVAYPLAACHEGRDIASKEAWLRAEMARPFAERRLRSQKALAEQVGWAGAHVPYYRDLFARLNFDPARLERDAAWLNDLPYLTKDVIREQGERMMREDREGERIHACKTGGSTGVSAIICYDQEAADWSSAVTGYARGSVGKNHFLRELHFASRFPETFPLRDRIKEHIKCFCMNRSNIFFDDFTSASLEAIWQQMRRIRPALVHGHPSTLYHLALHVADAHGGGRAFDIFESSGELLEPHQRRTIESVLRCRVVDRYGLAEFGVVAYEGRVESTWRDVYDPIAWPEVAEPEASVVGAIAHERGRSGELVLTGLKNRLMPLIRYRTGDLAVLGEEEGRGFVLYDLVGRIHDVVHIGGKDYATHYIQDLLDRLGCIREFQIVLGGAVPVLRLVLEPQADRDEVACRIRQWWGEEVSLDFIDATQIRLQGGRAKFRHVVAA